MPLGIGPRPVTLSPGRQSVRDLQGAFSGGLNTVSADDALASNQFRRGDNGRLTQFGAFTKRGGTQRTSAAIAAFPVLNGTSWFQPAGTVVPMVVVNGGLYTTAYGAFPLTWTNRAGALSTTVTPSFAEFLQLAGTDSVYIADGGLLNRYTGTTLTVNIASTPSCNCITVHNQRLYGCGDASYPDSIFYSALNDGDSLGIGASSGGQIVVRTFGRQNVTAVGSLGTSLMIFHTKGVSRLTGYGQSDITVTPAGISGDLGTSAPFSLVRVDNVMYFVSDRGLCRATEADVQPVSTPEQPDPLSVILPLMSSANIATIKAVLNRATQEIWIMVPGYGVYVYHTILKAWAGPWPDGYESPEVGCLFEAVNSSGYPIILAGDASGFVRQCDMPNIVLDNVAAAGTGGTSYTMALQARRFFAQDPMIAKAWRYAYVLGSLGGSAATTVNYTTDSASGAIALPANSGASWNGSGTVWNAGTWNASGQYPYRVPISGNGYAVDITVTDSESAIPVINQIGVSGYLLGRRGMNG